MGLISENRNVLRRKIILLLLNNFVIIQVGIYYKTTWSECCILGKMTWTIWEVKDWDEAIFGYWVSMALKEGDSIQWEDWAARRQENTQKNTKQSFSGLHCMVIPLTYHSWLIWNTPWKVTEIISIMINEIYSASQIKWYKRGKKSFRY